MKLYGSYAAILAGVLLGACASTKPQSVTFVAPSVAPVKQAVAKVHKDVQTASDTAKKLADACEQKGKDWAQTYDALVASLTDANISAAEADSRADELQVKNDAQAKLGNTVVAERDKAVTEVTKVMDSRHGWVKRFWAATGVAALLGLWTFRKPLLLAVGL